MRVADVRARGHLRRRHRCHDIEQRLRRGVHEVQADKIGTVQVVWMLACS
jgi:hypothetical protein